MLQFNRFSGFCFFRYAVPTIGMYFIFSFAHAQTDETFLEPVGQFGGDVLIGDVQDGYVYLSQGSGVSILRNTGSGFEPLAFVHLGGEVGDLQVRGDYLYAVLLQSGGFFVVDVSNPTSPKIMGSCDMESLYDAGVTLSGDYAYVAAENGGFNVVNISDPALPSIVKTVAYSYPADIDIENNLAAVLTNSTNPDKLELFDLSDADNPARLSSLNLDKVSTLDLAGDYVYIACAEYNGGENGLRIVDISNNGNPQEIAYLPSYSMAYNVLVEGDYAYLSIEDSLLIADISDKSAPRFVGLYGFPGATYSPVRGFHLGNNEIFLAVRYLDTPLQVLDISNPASPVLTSAFESPGDVQSVLTVSNSLFVSSTKKLFDYDISNPTAPILAKTYSDFSGIAFLKIVSNVMAGVNWNSVQLIDISDPGNLSFFAEYTPADGYPLNLALNESRLYLQTDAETIEIVNIENPASPVFMSSFATAGTARDIYLDGNMLYSAHEAGSGPAGVEIFQLQNDGATKLKDIEVSGTPMALWVEADTLFVGSNQGDQFTLQAYDIATPSAPELLASVTDEGEIRDIEVRGGAILAAVIGRSVIGYAIDLALGVLQQIDICHSDGSIQIATDWEGSSDTGTLYTSEGSSYMNYTEGGLQKRREDYSIASSTLMASGRKGIVVQQFKTNKPTTPALTLSGTPSQVEPLCPLCEDTVQVMDLVLQTNELDSWEVQTIQFQASGTGDDLNDIRQVELFMGDRRLSSSKFNADNGLITLEVGRIIPRASKLNLYLKYVIQNEKTQDDVVLSYRAATKMAWVSAEPENYDTGDKLPPETVFNSGMLLIAPVINVNTEELFASIQEGVEDSDTQDGQTLNVCPGVYRENVDVSKSLTIQSMEGRGVTFITAPNPDSPAVNMYKDLSKLKGFTISGASSSSGVKIAGAGADNLADGCVVFQNRISQNKTGVSLSNAGQPQILGNVICENTTGLIASGTISNAAIGNETYANTISGNDEEGLHLNGTFTGGRICGNRIGTSEDGSSEWGNGKDGLLSEIENGSSNLLSDNIISGNGGLGVCFAELYDSGWLVTANIIGMDASKSNALPNEEGGIQVSGQGAFIGGNSAESNTIASNKGPGIAITDYGETNQIVGNAIQKNICGVHSRGKRNAIKNNVITENDSSGIILSGASSDSVKGNFIGTNSAGETAAPNKQYGIMVSGGTGNIIGGSSSADRNIISGNQWGGIVIRSISSENVIQNNYIGITLSGQTRLDNGGAGMTVKDQSNNNEILNNVISGNTSNGITLQASSRNKIQNNLIGLDASGTAILGNDGSGILLADASKNNEISSNTLSGNNQNGICLQDKASIGTVIEDNVVGLNAAGDAILYNSGHGVTSAGDSTRLRANTISGNIGMGLNLDGDHCIVADNFIGTNLDGTAKIKNFKTGFFLAGSKCSVTGNLISGNGEQGMIIAGDDNVVSSNSIGVDLGSIEDLGNDEEGILVYGNGNLISSNIIAGNEGAGVHFKSGFSKCQENTLTQNKIGVGADNTAIGNLTGVLLENADFNEIDHNTIGHNQSAGIKLENACNTNIKANHVNSNSGAGIYLHYSNSCVVTLNEVRKNCKGIYVVESAGTEITGNWGNSNQCATGIHFDHSFGRITGNTVTADEADGVKCENGSTPVISKNNLYDNAGNGLNNLDASVILKAQDNWWGDASGPGGGGVGSGDEISGNVDYQGWRTVPVSLVAAAGADTLYLPIGKSDSVLCSFQNWDDFEDGVNVTLSDNLGWLDAGSPFSLAFADSMGADTLIYLSAPGDVTEGTINTVRLEAVLQNNPAISDTDSFVVVAYSQALSEVAIYPDSITVTAGDSIQFTTAAYDIYSNEVNANFTWTCTGGTVDAEGWFMAGSETGAFTVTIRDVSGQEQATAVVIIEEASSISLNPETLLPTEFALYQNYPNPFNPMTTIEYAVKEPCHVMLTIYDIRGREVMKLVDQSKQTGYYKTTFNASRLATGLYIYRIKMKDFVSIKKMMLLR